MTTLCVDRLLEEAVVELIPRSVLENLCPESHGIRQPILKSLRSDPTIYILQAAANPTKSENSPAEQAGWELRYFEFSTLFIQNQARSGMLLGHATP